MNMLSRPHGSLQTASLLAYMQEDLQVLFSSISESILLIEANGTIIVSNDIGARWLKRSAEELLDENLFVLLTPFGIPIREWVYEAVSKKTIFETETYFREEFLHFRLIPISAGNKIRRLIIIVQDITKHKRAEEQVREFTEQIERKVRERTIELEALNRKLMADKRRSEIRASLSQYMIRETRDYKRLLEHVSTQVADLIGDACMVALFTSDLTQIEVVAVKDRRPGTQKFLLKQLLNRVISFESNEIANRILDGKRYSGLELSKEKGAGLFPAEFAKLLGDGEVIALELFPLQTGDQSLGLLALVREYGNPFSEEEISFVNGLLSSLSLAIQNARLVEQLTESQTQLRGLSQQLVQIQEDQFSHLAVELHDSIGQDMTAINVNLNILRTLLPKDVPESVIARVADTEKLVVETIKHMRSTMAELRPPMLDKYGLTATLYWYCDEYQRRTQIQVTVNDRYMKELRLPDEIEIALFRIAQEALNNVAKHAHATQVEIEMFEEESYTMMAIKDNGCGFDPDAQNSRDVQHWGVPLMQERARAINGEFLLRSVPGQGTQIVVRVRKVS